MPIISYQSWRGTTFVAFTVISLLIAGCGGGGGGGGGPSSTPRQSPNNSTSNNNNDTPSATLGAGKGQVLLGPIVNATVGVYESDQINGAPVCTRPTSPQNGTDGPGVLDLTDCNIDAGKYYFFVVRGGTDIDVDDNGTLDSTPTAKNGALRAIISGEDILEGSFRINIVTELAYQSVRDTLLHGGALGEIIARLDNVANQLFKEDINGDGVINGADLYHFSPVEDFDSIAGENEALLNDILDAILSGDRGQLTNLSRQYLLASLGEHNYRTLVGGNAEINNLLIADLLIDDGILYGLGFEADSGVNNLRILIIDVNDFSSIALLSDVALTNLPSNPQGGNLQMIKVGEYLYIAAEDIGIIVVNVSNPAAPVATQPVSGVNFDSIAAGPENIIYISDFDQNDDFYPNSIKAYDISTPDSPSLIATNFGHFALSMIYNDGYLYSASSGLKTFEAGSNGTLNFLDNEFFPGGGEPNLIYKDGFVYMPYNDTAGGIQGIAVIDVSDPMDIKEPVPISGIGLVSNIVSDGEHIYTGTFFDFFSSSLTTFSIDEPGKLTLVDSRSAPLNFNLFVDGGRIYLSSSTNFIAYHTAALSNRTEPLDFLATKKVAAHVQVVDKIAFVADGQDLIAIDVSTPGEGLVQVGSTIPIQYIRDMEIRGDYAYLASSTDGLTIVDISDPANMTIVGANGEHTDSNIIEARSVTLLGDYAYTITGGLLGKFLVSEPAAPTLSAESSDTQIGALDLASKGNSIYAATGSSLHVYDADTLEFRTNLTALVNTITVDGDFAYTSSSTSGLSVFSVSNDANPIPFGGQLGLGIGNAVAIDGSIAYVANEFGFIEVYDVSDRTTPELITLYRVNGVVQDVWVEGDYVYAVNGLGLVVEPKVDLNLLNATE